MKLELPLLILIYTVKLSSRFRKNSSGVQIHSRKKSYVHARFAEDSATLLITYEILPVDFVIKKSLLQNNLL